MNIYRRPTSEDIQKISKFFPLVKPDSCVVIKILAFNNLKTRDDYAWGVKDVYKLAETFPGKPVIVNHDWDNVLNIHGGVFDASIVTRNVYSQGNKDDEQSNNFIAQSTGVVSLELMAYINKESPLMMFIEKGLLFSDRVSIGALGETKGLCPLSQMPFEWDIDAMQNDGYMGQAKCQSPNCKHCIIAIWGIIRTDVDEYPAFDFYIRSGIKEATEVSFVTVPNIPGAGLTHID